MCLYPIAMCRRKGTTGKLSSVASLSIHDKLSDYDVFNVPCGKCVQCEKDRALTWTYRCLDEAKLHVDNCFITLTYSPECLPPGGSLDKRDFQCFLKRLRASISPVKIRYFMTGEYGSHGQRPHAHFIIFGWKPDDLKFFQERDGSKLFTSPFLAKLWPFGYHSVGELSFSSCMYCCKYLQKLNPPPPGCIPAYVQMSTHPGIGYNAIDPKSLKHDRLYYRGESHKLPRYYLDKLELDFGFFDEVADVRERRLQTAEIVTQSHDDLVSGRKYAQKLVDKKCITS